MVTLIDTQYVLTPLIGRSLLAVVFLYVYRRKRERYLLYWTLAWILLALEYVVHLLWVMQGGGQLLGQGVDSVLLGVGMLLFLDSARVFSRGAATPAATVLLTPVLLLSLLLQFALGGFEFFSPLAVHVGSGAVAVATAILFWGESRRREMIGGTLLVAAFLLWGLVFLSAPLSQLLRQTLPAYLMWGVNLPELLMGVSMLIVLYEEEKRTTERHMLSLAGLNLITSTAQHATTVQDMLGQTLERVLGALRVSSGTIALTLSEDGQLSCIHRGEGGDFLHELERLDLIPYLHRTVTRLGGLVVLSDLDKPAAATAFAHEQPFLRLARLARSEGVRLLAGASLRARTGDRGVLLLASTDSRHFIPAELRLLLGVGGQIGMAVENYHLLQQSARRTEELRVLNEIGRALSSALSVDEILERIYAEMQRVLDVSNFYIALYDPLKEEVSFELEVKEGSFLPKRHRRARNGLTEYVLRHKRPLLIREEFPRVAAQLGVEPGRSAKTFCAVPILLHGEAVGVIGIVSYTRTNAFDQEHVEVLTILAAQTAVAIENARLFSEEQRRGQQLALLNNVSSKAISTLNPDEMLATIAAEVHASLPYDHIGFGVLDYAAREVVIQAGGSQGSEGLNRRFKLGEGCVGGVAMSGQMHQVEDITGLPDPSACSPVLADAQSLVALPIVYADQLLGVLNVESRKPHTFREEDVLLLRTLADQVASALHNAFVFQKAQEQAITDGLTGVKTHRFFMEALTAEWRRATRMARSFSLVLLDLDKFKFVNDYFGHLEGDTVLQRVGRVLQQNVRRSDVVARYGGDEFVVL
ncbi:MAG: GAF domain-containing protein, partial [Terriglobia bacterium]